MLEKQFTNRPSLEAETKNPDNIDRKDSSENNILNLNTNSNPQLSIKSKLSLGLIDEILRNPNLSEEEKQKYIEFKNQISRNNYLYIFDDINIHDYTLLKNIQEISEDLDNPKTPSNVPSEVDYDIELHKIGKSCHGMKKRYGIIQNGCIFSSKEPKNKVKDFTKLKDKSIYLQGAEILKENKDNWEKDKSNGEWHNKAKNFRIRVNYFIKPGDKDSKQSSFYLYFDNEQ